MSQQGHAAAEARSRAAAPDDVEVVVSSDGVTSEMQRKVTIAPPERRGSQAADGAGGGDDESGSCTAKDCAVRVFPVFDWGKGYNLNTLKADCIAGLTVGCMLVPQGMAYALLAGLDPIYGLYSSFLPLLIYSFFTTSRVQAVGPVAMDSLMTASVASNLLTEEEIKDKDTYVALVLVLSFFTGVIQIFFGMFRLGALVNFLSHSVMSGFTSAAAIIIGLSQFKHLFGLEVDRQTYAWQTIVELCRELPNTHAKTLPIAFCSCALLYGMKWWKRNKFNAKTASGLEKAFKLVCDLNALVVTILMSIWGFIFDITGNKVQMVSDVPGGAPPFTVPELGKFSDFGQIMVGSLMIGIIGFIELIAIAQMYATKKGYKVDTNQEFCSLGIANVVGSFFSAQPIGGSFSRTAVNAAGGAETPVSGAVTSVVIIIALLASSLNIFYYIPMATLAAIVEVAVIDLVKVEDAQEAWKVSKPDFVVMILSFLMTLGLGVIPGIASGCALSIAIYLKQTAYPHLAVMALVRNTQLFKDTKKVTESDKPSLQMFDGIVVARIDADIWFANCGYVKEGVLDQVKADQAHTIVIDLSACNRIDLSGLHMLSGLLKELEDNKVRVMLAGPKDKLLKQLRRANFKPIDKALDSCLYDRSWLALSAAQGLDAEAEGRDVDRFDKSGQQMPLAAGLQQGDWRPRVDTTDNDPRDISRDFFHVSNATSPNTRAFSVPKAKSMPHGKSSWQG